MFITILNQYSLFIKNFYSGINTLLFSNQNEDNKRVEIEEVFMKLTTPFTALRNATLDMWRMHDFNYKLPNEAKQTYWDKECIDHPTSAHCKLY